MSVVIVGGHDRMVRQYMDICKKFNCKSKVFTQLPGNFRSSDLVPEFPFPDRTGRFNHTVHFHRFSYYGDRCRTGSGEKQYLHCPFSQQLIFCPETYFGRTLLLIFTQWLAYANILKFDRKEDSHVRF